jgi:hypothetical protein
MLTLDQIDRLVGEVAATTLASGVVDRIFSEPTIDSRGHEALRITIVIEDDALPKISGDAALETLVGVHRKLHEAGEERLPIVGYATHEDLVEGGDPQP